MFDERPIVGPNVIRPAGGRLAVAFRDWATQMIDPDNT